MYVQIITYSLDGISEEEYLDVGHQLAARTASVPGLLAKIWLENEGANRYGGIYFWDDLESMERFGDSDLFEGHVPEFAESVIEEFGVLDNLTALTQPVLEVIAPRRRTAPIEVPPAAGPAPAPATPSVGRKRTPPPRKAPSAKKAAGKKAAAKKTVAKKSPAKKTVAKKSPAKKATAKKAAGKKAGR